MSKLKKHLKKDAYFVPGGVLALSHRYWYPRELRHRSFNWFFQIYIVRSCQSHKVNQLSCSIQGLLHNLPILHVKL